MSDEELLIAENVRLIEHNDRMNEQLTLTGMDNARLWRLHLANRDLDGYIDPDKS